VIRLNVNQFSRLKSTEKKAIHVQAFTASVLNDDLFLENSIPNVFVKQTFRAVEMRVSNRRKTGNSKRISRVCSRDVRVIEFRTDSAKPNKNDYFVMWTVCDSLISNVTCTYPVRLTVILKYGTRDSWVRCARTMCLRVIQHSIRTLFSFPT